MENIQFATAHCCLGTLLAAQSEKGLCAVFLGNDPSQLKMDLQNRFPDANITLGSLEKLLSKLIKFTENPSLTLDLTLDERGTTFQRSVWSALRQIPVGLTVSYSDIAIQIGQPKAVRAVAQACGQNPLAIVTPCHRVIRKDGSLSGYRWGIEYKKSLLLLEKQKT